MKELEWYRGKDTVWLVSIHFGFIIFLWKLFEEEGTGTNQEGDGNSSHNNDNHSS